MAEKPQVAAFGLRSYNALSQLIYGFTIGIEHQFESGLSSLSAVVFIASLIETLGLLKSNIWDCSQK